MRDIAAIVLAAGRSQRMGAFKPLLPFGDSTVIESCIDNLRRAGLDEIVVVLGHRADEIRDHLGADVRFAVNPDPGSEMSISIARGVEAIGKSFKALLIAPVDHPAVPAEVIAALVDAWRGGARLVQPEYGGRGGHPVLIDLKYRNELLNLDAAKGLRSLFDNHRKEVRRLPAESPYVARDMDTWEDYARLHEEVFGRPPQPMF